MTIDLYEMAFNIVLRNDMTVRLIWAEVKRNMQYNIRRLFLNSEMKCLTL